MFCISHTVRTQVAIVQVYCGLLYLVTVVNLLIDMFFKAFKCQMPPSGQNRSQLDKLSPGYMSDKMGQNFNTSSINATYC